MEKILLVEDNKSIAEGLLYAFSKNQYQIQHLSTLKETSMRLEKEHFALIILDVMLPDGDGLTFFKTILKDKNIPVIFLTAKDDEEDIVTSLNLGAEDYITKPFSTNVLLARVKKVLNRHTDNKIQVQDITFDLDKMSVTKNGEKIDLTSMELKILHLLFTNLNKVVSREVIIDKIWEWTGNDVFDNTVTVYLKRIREKLQSNIIITIKGIGYRIDEE